MQQKQQILRNWVINSIAMALFAYFVFHTIYGERGAIAYFRWQKHIKEAQAELDSVQSEKLALERKVSLLRPESLDPDMLDEQVRKVLGMSSESEKVFTVKARDSDEQTAQK